MRDGRDDSGKRRDGGAHGGVATMSPRPRKVLIFGLDGPVAPALLRYCREGRLPALARLIDNGVLAPNAMVPLPTAVQVPVPSPKATA